MDLETQDEAQADMNGDGDDYYDDVLYRCMSCGDPCDATQQLCHYCLHDRWH